MEDYPPLPWSRSLSRAPPRPSCPPDLTETHLYIRDFVRKTRQRLNFTAVQLPILDDQQLSELSEGERVLIPLSCSALNALASMTHQLGTLTTQIGNIQGVIATVPTFPTLESGLSPINASFRDLSQSMSAVPPPQAPAPSRPPVSPTGTTTRPTPLPMQTKAKSRAPPLNKGPHSSFDPDIPRDDADTCAFYGNSWAYVDKCPDSWETNAFFEGKYPDPTTCISGCLAPDFPKSQPSYTQADSAGAMKGRKNMCSLPAAKSASASNVATAIQAPMLLPTAESTLYAPRSSPSKDQQAPLIAATFPNIAAHILRDANCILPLAVTTKVNDRGSVTRLVTNAATPAVAFAAYFDALSCQLNKSFPVCDSPWLRFRLPPTRFSLPSTPSPLRSSQRIRRNSSCALRS